MDNETKNEVYNYELEKGINKEFIVLNKKEVKEKTQNLQKLFKQIINAFNEKDKNQNQKSIKFLLLKFTSILSTILIQSKQLDNEIIKHYINYFKFMLLENNYLFVEISYSNLLLLNNFIFIQNQLSQDLISFYNEFINNYQNHNSNTQIFFTILVNIYKNYYKKNVFQIQDFFWNILKKIISISHNVLLNANKNEELKYYISSFISLCIDKPSICSELSKSYSFINFCRDLLLCNNQNKFFIKQTSIILDFFVSVFDNKVKEFMLAIVQSPNFKSLNNKYSILFPFILDIKNDEYTSFKKTCFIILQFLIKHEKTYDFFADQLYCFSNSLSQPNKYFEEMFISFFYWNKLRNDNSNSINLNDIIKSFIENILPQTKTAIDKYNKKTLKEVLYLINLENEKDSSLLQKSISTKKEINNFTLTLLSIIISVYPENSFVISILKEIPNSFIVNVQEYDSFEEILKEQINNVQTSFTSLLNEIAISEEKRKKNLDQFILELNKIKICVMLKSKVINNLDEISVKKEFIISEKIFKSLFDILLDFSNFLKEILKYQDITKVMFDFFAFVVRRSTSQEIVDVFKKKKIISKCLNYIIKNEKIEHYYEIVKLFFLQLFKKIKSILLNNDNDTNLIKSLLKLIKITLNFEFLETELLEEIIEVLKLINTFNNGNIQNTLSVFYIGSSNLIKIIQTIFSQNIIINFSKMTSGYFCLVDFLKLIYETFKNDDFFFHIHPYEYENFALSLMKIFEQLIKDNTLNIINQTTLYQFLKIIKFLFEKIKFDINKIFIYQNILIFFDVLEILINNYFSFHDKFSLNHKSNNITLLFIIVSDLLNVYIYNKQYNYTDKEILIINSKILTILNNYISKSNLLKKEKFIKTLINVIIPNEKIGKDILINLNNRKSQLLFLLWNQPKYKVLLKQILLYIFNSENFIYFINENIINDFLTNFLIMVVNAKKCYQLFILSTFRNKWICSKFFANNILLLNDPSFTTENLILYIIKILDSSFIIEKNISENSSSGISNRSSRVSPLTGRISNENKMLLNMKEDKRHTLFVSQVSSSFFQEEFSHISIEDRNTYTRRSLKSFTDSKRSVFISKSSKNFLFLGEEESTIMIEPNTESSILETSKIEAHKNEFLLFCDKLKNMEIKKIKNPFIIEQVNENLAKLINNDTFICYIKKEVVNKEIIQLLQMSEKYCYKHTKAGMLLKLKLFFKDLNKEDLNSFIMESYFILNFKKINENEIIGSRYLRLKFEVFTVYLVTHSIDFDFLKRNDSIINLTTMLNLIKNRKQFNIEITINLLDIVKNIIKYLLNVDLKKVVNNIQTLKIILDDLLKTYPLIINIYKRIIAIFMEILRKEEKHELINEIIDSSLPKILTNLINFFINKKLSDLDFFKENSSYKEFEYIINIIHFYCCEIQNNKNIKTLFGNNNELIKQFFSLLDKYNDNSVIIEKGFYILKKAVKEVPEVMLNHSQNVISLLFVLLDNTDRDKMIAENVIIEILKLIISLLTTHTKEISSLYSTTLQFIMLKTLLMEFNNEEILENAFNIISIIINHYLNQKKHTSQEMNSFISENLIKEIIYKYSINNNLNVKIMKQISIIVHSIVKSQKFLSSYNFLIKLFLPESPEIIFKGAQQSELIDILLRILKLFCYQPNIMCKHLQSISGLLNEISQQKDFMTRTNYDHLLSFLTITIINIKECSNKNNIEIFKQLFQDLMIGILIKYNEYLDQSNVLGIFFLLQEEINLNIIDELSFIYCTNIFQSLLDKENKDVKVPSNLINLYEQILLLFSKISPHLGEESEENVKEFIAKLKEIVNTLDNIFQETKLHKDKKNLITKHLFDGIKQIGINNRLFIQELQKDKSENLLQNHHELYLKLLEIGNDLCINQQKYIIISRQEKIFMYETLSKNLSVYYYNNRGKQINAFISFELPKGFHFEGNLKLFSQHESDKDKIIFESQIQDISGVVTGTKNTSFKLHERKNPKRPVDFCFSIYFSKSFPNLNNENSISLELKSNPSSKERNIYVTNIDKLIKAMKPLIQSS